MEGIAMMPISEILWATSDMTHLKLLKKQLKNIFFITIMNEFRPKQNGCLWNCQGLVDTKLS